MKGVIHIQRVGRSLPTSGRLPKFHYLVTAGCLPQRRSGNFLMVARKQQKV